MTKVRFSNDFYLIESLALTVRNNGREFKDSGFYDVLVHWEKDVIKTSVSL